MCIIISNITAFLEYFILAGELSYIDRRCVGHQNISSRAKRAILYQIARFFFLHDYRIILYISSLQEHFISPGEQVLFHTQKALVPQNANLALIRQYHTNLLSPFSYTFLK